MPANNSGQVVTETGWWLPNRGWQLDDSSWRLRDGSYAKVAQPPMSNEPFVYKKYGSNGSVRWTHRSVHATILRNGRNTSLGTTHPAHSMHNAMQASN